MDGSNPNNMIDVDEQEAVMVRYLLGQSSEEERTQVEERYFSDRDYFDQLLALEDSLIDDFVCGRMPNERLDAFKQSLFIRKEDVRFTRALLQATTEKEFEHTEHGSRLRPRPFMQFSAPRGLFISISIVALLLLALSIGLYRINHKLRNELSENQRRIATIEKEKDAVEQELTEARSQNESTARELESERNKRIEADNSLQKLGQRQSSEASPDFIRIVLGSAFIPRGTSGSLREVRVPENLRWLQFIVPIKGYSEYESYRVTIQLAGQIGPFEKRLAKPSRTSPSLVVTVSATDLRQGDYIFTLYGERPAAQPAELERYAFRITS